MALPLFPLGTVLAPGARIPLRIFEPRYVEMLRTLLDSREAPEFGVVAIRCGHEVGAGAARDLFDVGCSAVLEHVEALPDGAGYAVRARAERRFRLDDVDATGRPYLVGDVTWLPERDGNLTRVEALARLVRSRLLAYRLLIGADGDLAQATGVDDRPLDPRHLSYRVGDLMLLPLADRQVLLEATTTENRLDAARRMLRREHRLVSTLHALPVPLEVDPPSAN